MKIEPNYLMKETTYNLFWTNWLMLLREIIHLKLLNLNPNIKLLNNKFNTEDNKSTNSEENLILLKVLKLLLQLHKFQILLGWNQLSNKPKKLRHKFKKKLKINKNNSKMLPIKLSQTNQLSKIKRQRMLNLMIKLKNLKIKKIN